MVYFAFRNTGAFFASLLAGILIDIDHILDYYLQEGITLKVKNIYLWCNEKKFEFIFLFLHSLELVFLLWAIIAVFKLGVFWIAFAIGITQHMILDIIFNPYRGRIYRYSYFLSYRIIKRFEKRHLIKSASIP